MKQMLDNFMSKDAFQLNDTTPTNWVRLFLPDSGAGKMHWNVLTITAFLCIIWAFQCILPPPCRITTIASDLSMSCCRSTENRHYPHGLNGSYCHVISLESRYKFVSNTSVYTNSSTTFEAARTVRSAAMILATLETTPQTGEPSTTGSKTNLDSRMAWRRFFKRISVLSNASWWSHPCLVTM